MRMILLLYIFVTGAMLATQVYVRLRYGVGAFPQKDLCCGMYKFPYGHSGWLAILISIFWPATLIPWVLVILVLIGTEGGKS